MRHEHKQRSSIQSSIQPTNHPSTDEGASTLTEVGHNFSASPWSADNLETRIHLVVLVILGFFEVEKWRISGDLK